MDNYETDAVARFIFSRLYGIIWGQQQADQTWPPANSGMSGNLADLEGKLEASHFDRLREELIENVHSYRRGNSGLYGG